MRRRRQTTTLTIRPGTTITFLASAPAIAACTLGSARAAASTVAGVGVGGDGDVAAHLAVDLHRVLDGVVDQHRRIGGRHRLVGDRARRARAGATAPRRRAARAATTINTSASATSRGVASSLVTWLLSSISLAIAVLKRSASMSARTAVDRAVQQPGGVRVGRRVDDADLTGLLVDDVAPQPLQEAEHADDVARLPRP